MTLSRLTSLGLIFGITVMGCGSGLEFSGQTPVIVVDAGPEVVAPALGEVGASPWTDANVPLDLPDQTPAIQVDAGPEPTSYEAPAPRCPGRQDNRANVCVRVVSGVGIPANPPAGVPLDQQGALVVGLSVTDPRENVSYAAKTLFPAPSTGASQFGIGELPKITEPIVVPPGKYYVYGVFRDQAPFERTETAFGDWVPLNTPLMIDVLANEGVSIELPLYPVRQVRLPIALSPSVAPGGPRSVLGAGGTGPLNASLSEQKSGRVVAERRLPCVDMRSSGLTIDFLTNYVGELSAQLSLFDFAAPGEKLDTLQPGTLWVVSSIAVSASDWVTTVPSEVRLDKVVPQTNAYEVDPTPTCAVNP